MDPRIAMLARQILQGGLGQAAPGNQGPPVPQVPLPQVPMASANDFQFAGQRQPVVPPAPMVQPQPRPTAMMDPMDAMGNLQKIPVTASMQQQQEDPILAAQRMMAERQGLVDKAKQKLMFNRLMNVGPTPGIFVHTPGGVQELGGGPMVRDDSLAESAARDLDTMSPQERKYVEDQVPGLQLPQDMTREEYRTGPLGKLQWFDPKTQAITESRERVGQMNEEGRMLRHSDNLAVKWGQLDERTKQNEFMRSMKESELKIRELNYDARIDSLRLNRQKFMESAFQHQQITGPERRELEVQMDTIAIGTWIRDHLEEFRDDMGPVMGRINEAVMRTGFALDDPRLIQLVGREIDMLGRYLTAQTGAQRGMSEVALLSIGMPKLTQTPEVALAAVEGVLANTMEAFTRRTQTYNAQGKNVEPFWRAIDLDMPPEFQRFNTISANDAYSGAMEPVRPPSSAAPTAQGQHATWPRKVRGPDGAIFTVQSEADWPEFVEGFKKQYGGKEP